MAKLWFQNGKLVTQGGKLVVCDECPCGSGGPIAVPCCPNPIPLTLTLEVVSFSSGDCAALIGQQFPLTYNAGTGDWEGSVAGTPVAIRCNEFNQWTYDACNVVDSPFNPVQQCSPFLLQYGFASSGTCCNGGSGTLVFEVKE